jgi:hypothetical protein
MNGTSFMEGAVGDKGVLGFRIGLGNIVSMQKITWVSTVP